MKRIIKEQSAPSANALNTNGIVNEPFNTYKDPQNREFIETFTILSLNQGTQGSFNIEVKDNQGNRDKFFFKCSDAGLGQDGYSNSLYSNNLVNELKKRYCTKSTGGAKVPNATFASNTNKAPQTNAMAEGKRIVKLTEADLTRLVKRVITEQSKQGTDLKTIKNLFVSKGYSFNPTGGYKLWGHKETTGPIKGKDGKYVWNYEVYIPSKPGNELWIDKRRQNGMGGTESENIIINLNGPEHMVKQVKNGKTINTQTLDLNGVSELIQNYKSSF